jgi:hypothetical protein
MLIGVNLLRHLHATFDFGGGQFVVRTFDPPSPPNATSVGVAYARGGGMLVRGAFGADEAAPSASLIVNTSMIYPLALDESAWTKAGVAVKSMERVPGDADLRHGTLPMFRLGAMSIPRVSGVLGGPTGDFEKGLSMNLDGVLGSGFLAAFRVTLVNGGRLMWLEDIPPGAEDWANAPPAMAPAAPETPQTDSAPPPGIGTPAP